MRMHYIKLVSERVMTDKEWRKWKRHSPFPLDWKKLESTGTTSYTTDEATTHFTYQECAK